MPRPLVTPAARWFLLALLCGAVPPAALQTALAAAAGSLFEAAPFVLAAELLAGRRFARYLPALGCGCNRVAAPGALSLPAAALAYLAFGPAVAAARFVAALTLVAAKRSRSERVGASAPAAERPDAFADLMALALTTVAASLAAQALVATHAASRPGTGALVPIFAAGIFVGALAPCATAAVAIAASLWGPLPAAAAGILCSGGLVPPLFRSTAGTVRPAGFASALLALALAVLAVRGPAGLVNPRLRGCIALGSLAAAAGARRRTTRTRQPALLPGAMLAVLVAGSPAPAYRADATTLASGFPGEHLDFVGVTSTDKGATTLERFAITCCRIDATAVAVRLVDPLPLPDGRWVAASGALRRMPDGSLRLQATSWRAVDAPPDPFTYR